MIDTTLAIHKFMLYNYNKSGATCPYSLPICIEHGHCDNVVVRQTVFI